MADGVSAGRKVRLTLRRSLIGRPHTQRRIVWGLGLRRVGAVRVHTVTPAVEGALRKVGHLLGVHEVSDGRNR